MGDTEGGARHQTRTTTLFLGALLLSAFQATLQVTLIRLIPAYPASSSLFFLHFLRGSLVPFLINPVLLFYVFYHLGKSVSLVERYASVGASLFVGGSVGFSVSFFLVPMALGSSWGAAFPDSLSIVTTALGFLLLFLRSGLDSFFPGFVAIAVANFRKSKSSAAQQEATRT